MRNGNNRMAINSAGRTNTWATSKDGTARKCGSEILRKILDSEKNIDCPVCNKRVPFRLFFEEAFTRAPSSSDFLLVWDASLRHYVFLSFSFCSSSHFFWVTPSGS